MPRVADEWPLLLGEIVQNEPHVGQSGESPHLFFFWDGALTQGRATRERSIGCWLYLSILILGCARRRMCSVSVISPDCVSSRQQITGIRRMNIQHTRRAGRARGVRRSTCCEASLGSCVFSVPRSTFTLMLSEIPGFMRVLHLPTIERYESYTRFRNISLSPRYEIPVSTLTLCKSAALKCAKPRRYDERSLPL